MSEPRFGRIYAWTAPADLGAMLHALRVAGWLPDGQAWWYGWHELAIRLPGQLNDLDQLPRDWERLVVWAPLVEVRQVRRGAGHQLVLLSEEPELPPAFATQPSEAQLYRVKAGIHLLEGGPLQLPDGPHRGVVALPRPLDYDLASATPAQKGGAGVVVAEVRKYYDHEARLRTTRYVRLVHQELGATQVPTLTPMILP